MKTQQPQIVVEDELVLSKNKQVGDTFSFLPEYKKYLKRDGDLFQDLNETFQLVVDDNQEKEMMKLIESFFGTIYEKCNITLLQNDDYSINIDKANKLKFIDRKDWNGFPSLITRYLPSLRPLTEEKYRELTKKFLYYWTPFFTSRNQRLIEKVFFDYYGNISLDKMYALPVSFLIFKCIESIEKVDGKLTDYFDETECNKDKFANMNFYDREPLVFLSKSNILQHHIFQNSRKQTIKEKDEKKDTEEQEDGETDTEEKEDEKKDTEEQDTKEQDTEEQTQNVTVKKNKKKKKKYIDNSTYLNKMVINKTSNKSLGRIVRVYNYVFVTHTNIVLKRLTENIEWVLK